METIEKIKHILKKHFSIVENEDWYNADVIAGEIAKVFSSKPPVIKSACDKHDWQLIAPNSSRCRKCGAV